jgi:lysophospholipase L1-like esterase
MADLARAHGIRVVLCALVPANRYHWSPEVKPAPKIAALNQWLQAYAARHRLGMVDFHSPMVDADQGLKAAFSEDGVHPNDAGYAVMQPLVERAIARALKR